MVAVDRKKVFLLFSLYKQLRRARYSRQKRLLCQLLAILRRQKRILFCIAELLENVSKLILLYNEPDPRSRSYRRLPRNNGWWENVINNYSDARFKEMFRMTKGTFYYILSKIEHRIEKNSVTVEALLH